MTSARITIGPWAPVHWCFGAVLPGLKTLAPPMATVAARRVESNHLVDLQHTRAPVDAGGCRARLQRLRWRAQRAVDRRGLLLQLLLLLVVLLQARVRGE